MPPKKKPKAKPKLKPFTRDHFRAYAQKLVLDNGEQWDPEDFQLDVLEDVFAGVPETWMLVPEGNGKSTLMGGLALYHGDYCEGAEVLLAASSRDQCEILFRQASGFVTRTDGMQRRFRVFEGYRRIKCLNTGGRIQVFAADDSTGDGVIPTMGLIDELHRHRDLRLYRLWRGKLDKRGGQIVTISTAGEPGTEFEETRELITKRADTVKRKGAYVRSASAEMVLHDWSVPADADVSDIAVVKAANPFTGVTKEILQRRFDSPTMTLAHWTRFVCNRPTRVVESAIQASEWHDQGVDDRIPAGEPIAIGLDLAWKWDTTALVPLWMRDNDYRLLGPAKILIPPRDGSSLDPHLVEDAFLSIHEVNPIHTVVMDVSFGEQFAAWVEETIGATVIEHGQLHKPMSLAYARFMSALNDKVLFHCKDPGLTSHVFNAVARQLPHGGARFDRVSTTRRGNKQDSRVIDALIAAAMVHSVMSAPQTMDKPRFEVLI